ncbi:dATP/dGTP pyrophosphohydrolase domain-containing protein [Klebsiella pneumoniae]|uniref:dATP/dGTP pyrophosphohydrolase domain-containing protein n=1 Tax=Klebsiella pneumoniae TaxID=573 RepID=UPI00359DDE8F
MTKSTITREQLLEIIETDHVQCGEASYLARMALAAMDSEPVALQPELAKVIYHFRDWNEGFPVERFKADYVISWMLANYPPMQPAKDREQVRREHAEWSQATFGNVGPVGPLKHLSKEALEAAAEPGDLSEWADMQFLLWDAQRRAGITDEQITQAMIEKLAVNKQRKWPEPKDGEPRLHIKEQPAPVVSADLLHTAASAIEDLLTTKDRTGAGVWFDLPFRLRSAANAQSPGSDPATVPGKWIPVSERIPDNTEPVLCIEKRADFGTYGQPFVCWHDGGGWVGKTNYRPIVTHWMPLPAAPQEVNRE